MKDIAIVSSVRSAVGKANKGGFKDTRPDELGAVILLEALARSKIDAKSVDDVIVGCAMPEAEQGMNVARNIALLAGMPFETSAATVNRFCSSGLHAIADVAKSISVGQITVGIGGGVESMSKVPMGGNNFTPSPELMQIMPEAYIPMGLTAERVAARFGVTREMQDNFALQSHLKAVKATRSGFLKDEIVPVKAWNFGEGGAKKETVVEIDEGPREDTTLEALLKLKPVFKKTGSVTAGNSSQVSDGAAFSVLCDAAYAQQNKLPLLGYFRHFVTAGVPPDIMGIGPVPAIRKLMKVSGLSISDIGVFEINEAFAAQAVYCARELGIDEKKINPCGGAIALGHPLGCTGARQVATILREMKRANARYGVCSMCIGGGMGAAGLIELA